MKSSLHIQLLGAFQLTSQQQAISSFKSAPRLQSLLGYLVLHSGNVNGRSQLAHLFWPDSTSSQARTNLRKLLYQLRKALPDADHYLHQEKETLRWNPNAAYTLDVDQLQTIFAHIESEPFNHQLLQDAAAHYTGELLPTVYDNWVFPLRRDLEEKTMQILERLIRLRQNQADYAEAIRYTEQILTIEPLAEKYYRWLMQLHAQNDDRLSAIHTYQRCTAMLQTQLSTTPSRETEAAYKQVMAYKPVAAAKQPVLIPFIGRQSEQQQLQAALTQSLKGEARFVCIAGDPGIGKTRLSEELLAWTQQQGIITARTRSYNMQGGLALAALTHLLREDALADRFGSLPDTWLVQIARLIPELLDTHPDLAQPGPVSEGWQRRQFYEAIARAILVDDSPVVLFFDDLQWLDAETLEWLHYLIRFDPQAKLLIVGTFRDNEVDAHHPLEKLRINLQRDDLLTDIPLTPFNETDSLALATAVFHTTIAQSQQNSLYANTQGNPLFIIETIRAQHGSQATDKSATPLPAKMSAVIRSRLSMLSTEAYDLTKIAANIGGAFDQELLAAISLLPEVKLTGLLDELGQQRIFTEHQYHQYDFSHDKIREVALDQTGPAQKRRLNLLIAQAKETVYAHRLEEIIGELAVAYERAEQYPKAVSYYHKAAQAEVKRGSFKQAERYLGQALTLINNNTTQHDFSATELELQLSLGTVLRAIQRNTVPKAKIAFERALALSKAINDQSGQFQALFNLAQYHVTKADVIQSSYFCQQCIDLAQQMGDELNLIRSRLQFGFICLVRGDFLTTKENMELVCAHQNQDIAEQLAVSQSPNIVMMANVYLSVALWFLGYSEQSDEKMAHAYTIATESGLPLNAAYICFYQMLMGLYKHDVLEAGNYADRLVTMSQQYEIGFLLAGGHACQAYVAASRRPTDRQLIEKFEESLIIYHDQVSGLSQPFMLSLKARLFIASERYEEAQAALTKAIDVIHAVDDRYSAAEVYRLQGELWTLTGNGNPEETYLHAIALATEQQAKMLQLRTAVSLCRFWQQQRKEKKAHLLLSDIYNWFSEGVVTNELLEAQALLNEL